MRIAFIRTLTEMAAHDKNIHLLTGDLGFSVFEDFAKKFPNQYLNCGVAEQNMMGMAAGMALCGKKVLVYSIVPFVAMRCFEQIRNDVCLHNLDVKVVGVGGGFSYGALGRTHHAIEDLAIMRALPNMTVLCPADPLETELAVRAMLESSGPAYLRLGKSKEENIYSSSFDFEIGRAHVVKKGKDIAVMGIGPILKNAILAAENIEKKLGITVRVVSMSTLKPLDSRSVIEAAKNVKAICTLEEHSIIGGLGDAVSRVLTEAGHPVIFRSLGIKDALSKEIGDQVFLREKNNLSVESIEHTLEDIWKSKTNTH